MKKDFGNKRFIKKIGGKTFTARVGLAWYKTRKQAEKDAVLLRKFYYVRIVKTKAPAGYQILTREK